MHRYVKLMFKNLSTVVEELVVYIGYLPRAAHNITACFYGPRAVTYGEELTRLRQQHLHDIHYVQLQTYVPRRFCFILRSDVFAKSSAPLAGTAGRTG